MRRSLLAPDTADRWVTVSWDSADTKTQAGVYEALMHIIADDSISAMADITSALVDMKVSILSINSQKRQNGSVAVSVKIACKNIDHFNSIVSKVRSLKCVISVSRGFS